LKEFSIFAISKEISKQFPEIESSMAKFINKKFSANQFINTFVAD